MKWIAFLTFICIPSVWADSRVQWLKTSHPSIFARESTAVTFLAQVEDGPHARSEKLALVQVDEKGNFVRYMGVMSDEGIQGDRQAGDRVFTRKIQVYEKRLESKYYAWVFYQADRKPEDQEHPQVVPQDRIVQIQVVHRPSFVNMVKKAFGKI